MKEAIIELTAAVRELAAAIKEGKEEHSPQTPYKEKSKKPTTKTTTRARERFVKPTLDEVAAHIREKGYTFDAEYEALGDDPERRDAIRKELYNLRWRLNSENDRKFHTTGKGRHFAALNGDAVQRRYGSDSPRWLEEEAKKLLESPEHAEIKHSLPTLCAIIRNRRNRAESIRELMRELNCSFGWAEKKYYADRKLLQKYFCVMGGK